MEFETAMHLEREQRVKQLESDIIDINEIMRDLSSMVTAQGDIVGMSTFTSNIVQENNLACIYLQ